MNDICVLDACALVALIKGEQGADVVWDIINKAATGGAVVLMHELNLLEVYYLLRHHPFQGHKFTNNRIAQTA
ncbi:MAG: hypothetical protein LBT22_08555 [Peptococcaceae bacterium]|jgi:PIN domain nuclease of toxin-antitoxin system|nr:hypothetical protein [Peptococcaceae bacterium]